MKIEGIVVHGKHLGRTIGFPTANVDILHRTSDDPDGVYAAFLDMDGKRYASMVNIGLHPTLPGGGKTVEVHIFDYADNAYGKNVIVHTAAFIRPEKKFASVEALRTQLEKDKITAKTLLNAQISSSPGIE